MPVNDKAKARRAKYIERNREYLRYVREEMFCEQCLSNDTKIFMKYGNSLKPPVDVMATNAYSLRAIQKKIEDSEWLCRSCLQKKYPSVSWKGV